MDVYEKYSRNPYSSFGSGCGLSRLSKSSAARLRASSVYHRDLETGVKMIYRNAVCRYCPVTEYLDAPLAGAHHMASDDEHSLDFAEDRS